MELPLAPFPGPSGSLFEAIQAMKRDEVVRDEVVPAVVFSERSVHRDFIRHGAIQVGESVPTQFIDRLRSTTIVCGENIVNPANFLGKFLVIACFRIPMPPISDVATFCRSLIDSYDCLVKNLDFEMILVTKGIDGDVSPAVFNHFVSAFHCPVVALGESASSDYFFSRIGSGQAIVIDQKQVVLQHLHTLPNFELYGSDWATLYVDSPPFLNSTLKIIQEQDVAMRAMLDPLSYYNGRKLDMNRPFPLYNDSPIFQKSTLSVVRETMSKILNCNFQHLHSILHGEVSTLEMPNGELMSVSNLCHMYVGVYLCADGSFMKELKRVEEHCLVKYRQKLHIVVVCIPNFDDPDAYMRDLREALMLCNISSWSLLHCERYICRRIWRQYSLNPLSPVDQLIIVPPFPEMSCNSGRILAGELNGKEVIRKFGFTEFPFIRTAILDQRWGSLKTLNPTSLFYGNGSSCLVKNGANFNSILVGEQLLLYIDWLDDSFDNRIYMLMEHHYPKMQAMGVEVVFVPRVVALTNPPPVSPVDLDNMPWPYLPYDVAALLVDKLTFPEERGVSSRYKYLVAVSEHGRVQSRDVRQQLINHEVGQALFSDVLYQEMAYDLCNFERHFI